MTIMEIPAAAAPVRTPSTVWPLARIEAKRYARHPLFLTGLFFALLFSAGEHGPIELDYHVIPSFFIGVFGIIVGYRLTTSTRKSRPVIDASPVSRTMQTAALCMACVVPAGAGLLVVLMHRMFVLADPFPERFYGTYGTVDRFLIAIVVPAIACAGGPLLGVAVGRWLRFPGAALLTVVVVLVWGNISGYLPTEKWQSDSFGARLLHMAGPYTAFASSNADANLDPTVVHSFTGSPFWYAVWTLALCGLAAAAAMWRGAEGLARRRVGRAFVVIGTVALVALALSVVTGNQHLYDTTEHGTVVSNGWTV